MKLAALLGFGLLLLIANQVAPAQPQPWIQTIDGRKLTVTVDTLRVGIGDRFMFSIVLETEDEKEGEIGPHIEAPNQQGFYLGTFLVAEQQALGPIRLADGRRRWQRNFLLQAEQAGQQTIPPLRVEFDSLAQHVLTKQVTITVTSVVPEDALVTHPRDIAAPALPLAPASGLFGGWLQVALVGLLALLLFGRYWSRRREPTAPATTTISVPASAEALRALDDLQAQALDHAHSEAFYSCLSAILRRYLTVQFGFPAIPRTTSELLTAAAANDSPIITQHDVLRHLLAQCDLVKFAAQRAHPPQMQRSLQAARAFIQQTATAVPIADL